MVSRLIISVLITIFFVDGLNAQVNRYVVHLRDKANTPYSITQPLEFLSQRSIDRRLNQGISINESDLPVDPAYIQGVQGTGAEVYYSSRWMNALIVEADQSLVPGIEAQSYVKYVEFVGPGSKLNSTKTNRTERITYKKKGITGATDVQNAMMGVDVMHSDGYRGEGMMIAVFDSGFPGVNSTSQFQHIFDDNRMVYTYDMVNNRSDVYGVDDHGTHVFSCIGAYEEDEYVGTAYESEFMLFITEDACASCEHRIEEYNWLIAAERADSAGVDIINTSLGYNTFFDPSMNYTHDDLDGNTALISRAGSIAVTKGILLVTSAGNQGNDPWRLVTPPGDVDYSLVVGAVDVGGDVASFSSIGPTADGRIKPDVVSLGRNVAVIMEDGSAGLSGGTSFSTPLVAGLMAGLWQANPELTNAELIDLVRRSASNAINPDNEMGYGIPRYESFIQLSSTIETGSSFVIFPNPVNKPEIKIRARDPGNAGMVTINITNTRGQRLFEGTINFSASDATQLVSLEGMQSGPYIVVLESAGKTERFMIMKM